MPGDQWVMETDPLKTAFMLLAHHATGERDAGIAALHTLISHGHIDHVAYALAAAFAELAQPHRDRNRPFTNLAGPQPHNDDGVIANTVIAAAANRHRAEADLVLSPLPLDQKIRVVSLLLELVLLGIRRSPRGRGPDGREV